MNLGRIDIPKLDSTIARAHRQSATGKGGRSISRWGLSQVTTKFYMRADGVGRPLRISVTTRQTADITAAPPCSKGQTTKAVLADKPKHSVLARLIAVMDEAVIPST